MIDYASLKSSLGLKPTRLDTGFEEARRADYPPSVLNRKASSSARRTLRALEAIRSEATGRFARKEPK